MPTYLTHDESNLSVRLDSQSDRATDRARFSEPLVKSCTEQELVWVQIDQLPSSLQLFLSRLMHPPTAFESKIAALSVS